MVWDSFATAWARSKAPEERARRGGQQRGRSVCRRVGVVREVVERRVRLTVKSSKASGSKETQRKGGSASMRAVGLRRGKEGEGERN